MADAEFIRRRTTETALSDGTRIRIRPIVPDDRARLLDGFHRLTPESRYRRFMAAVEDLTDDQLDHLTQVDYRDHFAWIALALDESGPPAVGVARYVRLPDEPEVAEAAVTVVDDHHGRGLGHFLLRMLGAQALENGIRRFRAYTLAENRPLLELAAGMGAHLEHQGPGLLRVEVDLPRQAAELRGTTLYELLRMVARGDGPAFIPPEAVSTPGRRG